MLVYENSFLILLPNNMPLDYEVVKIISKYKADNLFLFFLSFLEMIRYF